MPLKLSHAHLHHRNLLPTTKLLTPSHHLTSNVFTPKRSNGATRLRNQRPRSPKPVASASLGPQLDLTEDNIEQVLEDAKTQLAQLFDASVNITGKAELAELDGPYVKIRLSGRFWHKRSTVLARLGNYLKQRIPELKKVAILVQFDPNPLDRPENPAGYISVFWARGNRKLFSVGGFWFQEILEVDIEDEKQLDDSPENF